MAPAVDDASVPSILNEVGFEPPPGYLVNTVVPRTSSLLALLLLSDSRRRVVIIEKIDGRWRLPTMQMESPWDPNHPRPDVTDELNGIAQLSTSRYSTADPAWAHAGDRAPETAWIAVTGVAAWDAEGVMIRTAGDRHAAPVAASGIFVGLVRGRWSERPRMTVQTTGLDFVDIIRPG
jgi:hypothetical protein